MEEEQFFEGMTEERVERYTKMLDEMWMERERLVDLRERTEIL